MQSVHYLRDNKGLRLYCSINSVQIDSFDAGPFFCFVFSILSQIVYRLKLRVAYIVRIWKKSEKSHKPLQNGNCNPCTIHGRIWSLRSDHPYIAYGFALLKSVRYIWMIRAWGAYSSINSVRIAFVILEGPLVFYKIACAIRTLYMED